MTTHHKVQHTPGPWDDASNYAYSDSVRIFAGTRYIATVGNSDDTREQTEANARLIAAAPDLLAALKECAFRLGVLIAAAGDFSDVNARAIDAAQAAIAKAEG